MTPAAKSVYFFGIYLYIVGLTLIFIPNVLLSNLGIPETKEVWIRVTGALAFIIGYYYHRSGANNVQAFFKLTVPARVLVFIAFTVFVLMQYISPVLAFFGMVDLAGALWTWQSLKKR
jgi:hypothetical protein